MSSHSDSSGSSGILHDYQALTPDVVMDALASVGLFGDGRLMALSSYENRVYQAHLEDGSVVVAKFYRPGRGSHVQILEEHSFAAELMAAEIPAVGPLVLEAATLHNFAGFAFSVSPSRGGRAPELDDFEVLEWIGRFLARIHTVGAKHAFVHRPALDLQTFGMHSRDWLVKHEIVPLDVQGPWQKACTEALDLIAASALPDSAGGLKSPNIKTLRLIHYSAWLARRWSDPTFPVNFPWFGSSDYWVGQVNMLTEQIEAMQEEPLYV